MLKQLRNIAQKSLGEEWIHKLERYESTEHTQRSTWAPIRRTESRVPEITPEWVKEHQQQIRIVDVREHHEYYSSLGHIQSSELVPLHELSISAKTWDQNDPVVLISCSGKRSSRAALQLEKMGFFCVASMTGGMIHWKKLMYPIAPPRFFRLANLTAL